MTIKKKQTAVLSELRAFDHIDVRGKPTENIDGPRKVIVPFCFTCSRRNVSCSCWYEKEAYYKTTSKDRTLDYFYKQTMNSISFRSGIIGQNEYVKRACRVERWRTRDELLVYYTSGSSHAHYVSTQQALFALAQIGILLARPSLSEKRDCSWSTRKEEQAVLTLS